jgi:hypothetical protein
MIDWEQKFDLIQKCLEILAQMKGWDKLHVMSINFMF